MNHKRFSFLPQTLREFLLIVVGILIALQIENWNENRKDRLFKEDTLGEIRQAIQTDLRHLQSRISRLNLIEKSMISAAVYLEEKRPHDPQFDSNISRMSWGLVFEPVTAPFETLRTTGLENIRQARLRSGLMYVYDQAYPRMAWLIDHEIDQFNQRYANPYLSQHFSFRVLEDESFWPWRPLNYDALLTDEEQRLLTLIHRKRSSVLATRGHLDRLIDDLEQLTQLISDELGTAAPDD